MDDDKGQWIGYFLDDINNEDYIKKQYDIALQQVEPYALVCVNIKNFKYQIMKYGCEQGNYILKTVYFALQQALSNGEDIGYCGDDQFNLLIKTGIIIQKDNFNDFVWQQLMRFVDSIFNIKDEKINHIIHCSFGVYQVGIEKCSFYEAQQKANLARLQEKGLRRRTYSVELYTQQLCDTYLKAYETEESVALALQRNEYRVFIQPKVDTLTRKIVGGEALLRRFDKDGKMIPLNEFLPILTKCGYINKVDWFVFETVCEYYQKAMNENKPLVPISFNISKNFFYDAYMCDNYIKSFSKYNLPQKYIEFELMENISLDDTEQMLKVISILKEAGFSCSLDDFGNGYSSFCVLLNTKFDYIKMDRQFFVQNLNGDNKVIIKGIIDMLKTLDLKIVAEGVETKDYVDYLTEIGCDIIQGYYFYKPMPIEDFLRLLETKT